MKRNKRQVVLQNGPAKTPEMGWLLKLVIGEWLVKPLLRLIANWGRQWWDLILV